MFLLCSVLKCLSEENFDHQRNQVPRVSGRTRCCKVSCDSGCWRSNGPRSRAACWVEGVHLVPQGGGDRCPPSPSPPQVRGLLASTPRPSSLSTSPLAVDKPMRRCRSERRSQSLGERDAVLTRSLTERRGVFSRSRNPGAQDALRSPLQRFQAKFARASSLEVPDVVVEPNKFTIPEIKLDVPEEESLQLQGSRLY